MEGTKMNTAVLTEEVLEVLEESEIGYRDGDFFLSLIHI